MSKNILVLQGSSRADGHTQKIVNQLGQKIEVDTLILSNYSISPYDYNHEHKDDFMRVMECVINYDVIVLATPVYWYAMSGIMKTFLDRITDCLKIRKDVGRQLKGKKLAAISCGSEDSTVLGFFEPFKLSAEYLGMEYLGDCHTWYVDEITADVEDVIHEFANRLLQ